MSGYSNSRHLKAHYLSTYIEKEALWYDILFYKLLNDSLVKYVYLGKKAQFQHNNLIY